MQLLVLKYVSDSHIIEDHLLMNPFKVAWLGPREELTWELASSIPKLLIEEFEAGISSTQETLSTETKYGVISHTLVTSTDSVQASEPPTKHMKVDSVLEDG